MHRELLRWQRRPACQSETKMKCHDRCLMIYFFILFRVTLVMVLTPGHVEQAAEDFTNAILCDLNWQSIILISAPALGTTRVHTRWFVWQVKIVVMLQIFYDPKGFLFNSDLWNGMNVIVLIGGPDSILVCRSVDEAWMWGWQKTVVFWIK